MATIDVSDSADVNPAASVIPFMGLELVGTLKEQAMQVQDAAKKPRPSPHEPILF